MPAHISTPASPRLQRKPRRYLTKFNVRDRYGWKTSISVDRAWRRFKTLPKPTLYHGRRPLWAEDILDRWDQAHRFVEDEA
jgi:hypothetical protein